MRKITLLLLLLCMTVGMGARVITTTPVAGVPYKIKCIATDHTGYLGDDGTTLQGRHATGTWFVLESTGTEGQYYLKSQETGKYINAAGNASGDAITFDATATTYWTLDQTNANTTLHSWAIRPNGTAGVSLNNNGSATADCPYMKVNGHNSNTQGCNLWTFYDSVFEKSQFGGTVWTWNTGTNVFDANGKTSTAAPDRADSKGPVYKFRNVGKVTITPGANTSDNGGIWVISNTSNVTSTLGGWAGSILVEDYAVASVSYSNSLKGTEPDGVATVWTNGTLSITGRTNFDMNDGGNQRWYIGENGVVNTNFTAVTKGSRSWDIQIVVADAPVRTNATRVQKSLTKKVMTWGADLSSSINSITVWHKDAEGNLTQLDDAVTCDATGITVAYTAWVYEDEKTPSLPEGKYISVSGTKADFLTPATGADDNAHWYLLTQNRVSGDTRDDERRTPIYDNGNVDKMHRAAVGTILNGQPIAGNERYLVRFFENGDGLYDIQFATGNFVNHDLKTGSYGAGGTFNLYNINNEATHIGWNKAGFANIVDNNGAGNDLAYWESGQVTRLNGNNDWSLYPVEFIDASSISYTLHSDVLNTDYTGTYSTGWGGDNTLLPTLAGAAGYTLTDAVFAESEGNYTLTANITFPFPVSDANVENATGIESALGNSKWFVNESGVIKANNTDNTTILYATQDNWKWYIYPTFNEGTFSFKIKHSTGKYIPSFTGAQNANTANTVVESADEAGVFYFMPCTGTGNGFSINAEGTIFLTVNTSGTDQNIWTWTKPAGSGHQGSNLTFPDVTVTLESLQAQIAELAGVEKFDILEGSTVKGPDEFAAPEEINAAIDAAGTVDTESIDAMEAFLSGTDASKIKNYRTQVATYGALFNHQFTVKYPYSTIILPCPSRRPEGITLYTCEAAEEDGTTLTLVENSGSFTQDVPYIMEATVGNKYTIIGWDKGSRATHTQGWLTGVLAEGTTTVPADSYVLAYQKSTGKQGFFQTDGTVELPQCMCYLTPTTTQGVKAFYFGTGGETTGIESIFGGNDGEIVIYNLAGQRLNKLQKGVNIVNGHKILVK